MLQHIYSDPALLATIRAEIAPHLDIEESASSGLPISEPRRLARLDRDGLCSSCPVLKSVYIECLRLDTASWSLKVVQNDVVLRARNADGGENVDGSSSSGGGYVLKKGDYVHAAHDLHNTDPRYFPDPLTWKAERHVKFDEGGNPKSADLGSIRPYGT
jgi:cytochrome P450